MNQRANRIAASGLVALAIGCAPPESSDSSEDIGIARQRTISSVSELGSLDAKETSAAWTSASFNTCKNQFATVVGFTSANELGAWASNCTGTWVEQTTSSWNLIPDGFGNTAAFYGSDPVMVAIPGRPGQVAYVDIMHTGMNGSGPDDLIINVSNNGGQSFAATPTLVNFDQGHAGADRPFAVADAEAMNGTIYIAWVDTGTNQHTIRFRKATVDAMGIVTLGPLQLVTPLPTTTVGNFRMAVEHGSPNTVHFAFPDSLMPHNTLSCGSSRTVNWFIGSSSDEGVTWSFAANPFDTTNLPFCAKGWNRGGSGHAGYAISTTPELVFNEDLGTMHAGYSKVGSHGNVAAVVFTFGPGSGSAVEVDTKNESDDQFRISFATTPPGVGTDGFGIAYYISDSSGVVSEWMNESTTGSAWNSTTPFQVSAATFFLDLFNGDYAGMAATSTSHFWPTWIDGNSRAAAGLWTP